MSGISGAATTADPGSPSSISIRGLQFTYPGIDTPALRGIDLLIARGRCFGLLGPNGAGKTTLLSLLTGVLRPDAGTILVNGRDLAVDNDALATSALVPQDFAFYAALTGRENLECFAGVHGLRGSLARERISQAAETCGLGDILNRQAGLYSGGVKRRLNLAIGLLNRPAILYLDEPTVGIDAQSRRYILEAIRGLRHSEMTVVYTSHYMEEIQFLCDDVAVIDDGTLRLQGTLDGLLHGASSRAARFTLSVEPSPGALAALEKFGAVTVHGRQVRLIMADGRTSLTDLLDALASAGLSVEQCEFGQSQMEDIYLAVTERRLRE